MSKLNDVHSIIMPAQSANLTAHTYTEIYGGSAGCVAVINGQTINIGSSSSVFISIRSISGGTGCFVLGDNKYVGNPPTTLP